MAPTLVGHGHVATLLEGHWLTQSPFYRTDENKHVPALPSRRRWTACSACCGVGKISKHYGVGHGLGMCPIGPCCISLNLCKFSIRTVLNPGLSQCMLFLGKSFCLSMRNAWNPIFNALCKTTSPIFSACKRPKGTYLQSKLHNNHSKPWLQGKSFQFIACKDNCWCSFALCIKYRVPSVPLWQIWWKLEFWSFTAKIILPWCIRKFSGC